MAKKHFGECRLTGVQGHFVESHIIPKALTRPQRAGAPFTQGGKGQRPVRRWKSWTDSRLVTRKGENLLRDLDTWAIPVLRDHHLIWSGWDGAKVLPAPQQTFDSEGRGFRRVGGIDPVRLRLFLLSLLWRAAASSIPEMSEIDLPVEDLERLRLLVLNGNPGPISFYPAQLSQLSTIGPTHNQTPIAQTKTIPSLDNTPERAIRIFRFYFEGLIVHVHRHAQDDGYTASLGELVVGHSNQLAVTTIPYEVSFQRENLEQIMSEAATGFPDVVMRLAWPANS